MKDARAFFISRIEKMSKETAEFSRDIQAKFAAVYSLVLKKVFHYPCADLSRASCDSGTNRHRIFLFRGRK